MRVAWATEEVRPTQCSRHSEMPCVDDSEVPSSAGSTRGIALAPWFVTCVSSFLLHASDWLCGFYSLSTKQAVGSRIETQVPECIQYVVETAHDPLNQLSFRLCNKHQMPGLSGNFLDRCCPGALESHIAREQASRVRCMWQNIKHSRSSTYCHKQGLPHFPGAPWDWHWCP